jgi:hypothetical protein
LCLCACLFSGCIRRTLSITSEPAGAQLIVNGEAAGTTPAKLIYHHHGVYRVELRKPGYRPVLDKLKLGAKLYERAPIDFAADVLWPGTIRDDRSVHYRLKKTPRFDLEETLAAAERAAAAAEQVIPKLYQAPRPKPGTRDRPALPGKAKPAKPAKPAEPEKMPRKAAKKPATDDLEEPPDVPEIEEGRKK